VGETGIRTKYLWPGAYFARREDNGTRRVQGSGGKQQG
jgi:hypothetical protein